MQKWAFKEDISRKINNDFGENSAKASDLIQDAIKNTEYLKTDRIIRCIVFLSKGDLSKLIKHIEVATQDPRDIMLWAEYEQLDGDFKYKRIRDFNNTFEESTTNVTE